MNRLFVLFIFILISFTISADEIEILSDIPGNGPEIKFHYKIKVNYRGFFEDNTEFDSSYKRNKPLEFLIFEVQEKINKTKKNNKILFVYNK